MVDHSTGAPTDAEASAGHWGHFRESPPQNLLNYKWFIIDTSSDVMAAVGAVEDIW